MALPYWGGLLVDGVKKSKRKLRLKLDRQGYGCKNNVCYDELILEGVQVEEAGVADDAAGRSSGGRCSCHGAVGRQRSILGWQQRVVLRDYAEWTDGRSGQWGGQRRPGL